jgi:hypothetical protein
MEALNTGTIEIEEEGQEPERGKRFLMLLTPHLPLTICLTDLFPHIITTQFLCSKSLYGTLVSANILLLVLWKKQHYP